MNQLRELTLGTALLGLITSLTYAVLVSATCSTETVLAVLLK